ncbi:MAG: teicoplanin resistance protein VanZ, partial [Leptothrix sp. (in: b-proteobacteria)]
LARAAQALQDALEDTPLADWVPLPVISNAQPGGLELVVIVAGLLAPCWVAFVMTRQPLHRLVLLGLAIGAGVGATTLSTLLNFGPEHALAWVTPALAPALALALVLGGLLALLPRRLVAALGLVGITSLIALVTHAGADPYFASSLHAWEQGRFIRFHGVAQWVGWVWPFAALGFLLLQAGAAPDPASTIRP